jgi:hypothetical protein
MTLRLHFSPIPFRYRQGLGLIVNDQLSHRVSVRLMGSVYKDRHALQGPDEIFFRIGRKPFWQKKISPYRVSSASG